MLILFVVRMMINFNVIVCCAAALLIYLANNNDNKEMRT